MQPVSLDFIADLFLEEPGPRPILITIDADGVEDGPIRVTNYPGKGEAGEDGMTSNGDWYSFAPFSFGWCGASKDQPAKDATLTIEGISGEIDDAIDRATGSPMVTVQAVRLEAPDSIEMAITGARLYSAETDGPKGMAVIRPRDFSTEPACHARATLARTPSLF